MIKWIPLDKPERLVGAFWESESDQIRVQWISLIEPSKIYRSRREGGLGAVENKKIDKNLNLNLLFDFRKCLIPIIQTI